MAEDVGLSGLVSTTVMVLAFQLAGTADKYFTASLSLAISTTTVSYLLVFPALIKLRHSHRHMPRPFRVPFGNTGAWIASVLCTGWTALATASLLYPGFGTSHPDASLPDGWAGRRAGYELTQLVPLAFLIVVGLLFYAAGAPTRRRVAEIPIPEQAETARA